MRTSSSTRALSTSLAPPSRHSDRSMKVTFDLDIEPRVFPYTYYVQLGESFYDRTPSYDHHDGRSLHSIGWIRGGADATSRGLVFDETSTWSLGVVHKDAMEEFLASVDEDPEIIPGMRVTAARPVPPPAAGQVRYWAESPILLRRDRDHLPYDDPEADERLTYSLRRKLEAVGLPEPAIQDVHAQFDTSYDGARTKVARIKDAEYKANVCPVIIEAGDSLLHELAMSTGLGALTGMGLGAIRPASNQPSPA